MVLLSYKLLKSFQNILKVCRWYFSSFLSKEHLQPFVDYMNKQHRCIKFTSETEKVYNVKHLFIRKPTFSDVYGHYESYVSLLHQSYKKSLIFTFLSRCYSVCSDSTLYHLKLGKLRYFLKKNSYPSGIIELSIRTFLKRLYVPKQVYLVVLIKGTNINSILSLNLVIKCKAKSANFRSKFTTAMWH